MYHCAFKKSVWDLKWLKMCPRFANTLKKDAQCFKFSGQFEEIHTTTMYAYYIKSLRRHNFPLVFPRGNKWVSHAEEEEEEVGSRTQRPSP